MSVTDGQIINITGMFAKHTAISCLNLSSNGILGFEKRSLVHLTHLNVLDLSHNNLQNIPHFKKGHVLLDISGELKLLCSSNEFTFYYTLFFLNFASSLRTQLSHYV